MASINDQIRLLRQLAGAQQNYGQGAAALIPMRHQGLDTALGGGLQAGKLHELFAARPDDFAGAAAVAGLLGRNQGGSPSSPLVWLREEQAARRLRLHAPGLAALGIDPGRLLLAVLPDADAVLRAAADVLRCASRCSAVAAAGAPVRALDPHGGGRSARWTGDGYRGLCAPVRGRGRLASDAAAYFGRQFTVRHALASTPSAAHALARFPQAAAGEEQAIRRLPVAALRLPPEAETALHRRDSPSRCHGPPDCS